jgi:hypothetical protein
MGFRKVLDTSFMIGFIVEADACRAASVHSALVIGIRMCSTCTWPAVR